MKTVSIDQNDDFFELDLTGVSDNKRKAVRYVRPDIQVKLLRKGLFRVNEIDAILLDISSKGALIACDKKISSKSKLALKLAFPDGKEFTLAAKAIHSENLDAIHYGLKFNKTSDELGEYLLSSQNDLIFK